ncbi:helix-turn-helix domain-containing protein [Arthrobacter sp. NPDC090010]|uniref:helix-turn-helix domain-containing protein n=1 Tax=Arthrobacter sp. NPDC090010 TaxID=3363942 RepID=UPI0037F9125A
MFGARLREERLARGLTQEQLSGPVCSSSHVSMLERGAREPGPLVLDALAEALGLPREELEHWNTQSSAAALEGAQAALQARTAWALGDHETAERFSRAAAHLAMETSSEGVLHEMSLMGVESLIRSGKYREARKCVKALLEDPRRSWGPGAASELHQMAVRVALTRKAVIEAEWHAREALQCATLLGPGSPIRLAAMCALLAVLLERGRTAAAWRLCLTLEGTEWQRSPAHLLGRLARAMGDAAFARNRSEYGVRRHEEALALLSPLVDLGEWLDFNLSSARFRLDAGMIDDATARCLERARFAATAFRGRDSSSSWLMFLEAQWLHLKGRHEEAQERLDDFLLQEAVPDGAEAHAAFLRAKIFLARGARSQALDRLTEAQDRFFRSGDVAGARRVTEQLLLLARLGSARSILAPVGQGLSEPPVSAR